MGAEAAAGGMPAASPSGGAILNRCGEKDVGRQQMQEQRTGEASRLSASSLYPYHRVRCP